MSQDRGRYFREPIVYTIGQDIAQTQYDQLIQALGDWFAKSRKTREPVLLARQLVDQCLQGKTTEGQPWFGAASSTLADRIRIKCRFDMDKMQPLLRADERTRARKERKREKVRQDKKKDALLPDEVAKVLGADAPKYGDNPHVHLSTEEAKEWHRQHAAYLQQFPELRSVNASSELALVCDLQILAARYRHKALMGQAIAVEELARITKELATLKSALGIHPDQIAKRVKPKTDTTIGAAAARLEALGNYRELRARFQMEEWIQLLQMYYTPRADGRGYQLDEAGFYAATKCRTCHCPHCGSRNAAGFAVEELEDILIERGHLVPLQGRERRLGTEASVILVKEDDADPAAPAAD